MKSTPKAKFIILLVGIYLFSTGVSFIFFRSRAGRAVVAPSVESPLSGKKLETRRSRVDLTAPQSEECPLNGAKYTKAEKDIWEKRRPLGIMIENHLESRPQSGISKADVIYEAVAEGGITRFLTIFYCGASAEEVQVGPIRSARTYFLDWISEYGDNPLYTHYGGANCNRETGSGCANGAKADALGQIETYKWGLYNDINGFSVGLPTIWRDTERYGHPVAWEHTAFSTTDKLWDFAAKKRKLAATDENGNPWDKRFVKWLFRDEAQQSDRGEQSVSVTFWEGYTDYAVKWDYDKTANIYKRTNGGSIHKDMDYDEQLTTKNVVVAFMKESRANDGYDNNLHLIYTDKGSGKAVVFQNGEAIEGTWNKKDRLSRTKFLDTKGKEIRFNRGQIWIEIVPTNASVVY